MKHLFFVLSLFVFFSCNSKGKVDPRNVSYDTVGQVSAFYFKNANDLIPNVGPVKKIIIHTSTQVVDSTSTKGKYIIELEPFDDTAYLAPAVDSTLILKDTANKPILTKEGKTQYLSSFRNPLKLPKYLVQETNKVTFSEITDSSLKSFRGTNLPPVSQGAKDSALLNLTPRQPRPATTTK